MTPIISSLHMHVDVNILFFTCKFAQMLIYRQLGKSVSVCLFIYMQFIITISDCINILNAFNIHVTYFYVYVHKKNIFLLCLGTSNCVMLKIFCLLSLVGFRMHQVKGENDRKREF